MKRIFQINLKHPKFCLEKKSTYYILEYFDVFTRDFFGLIYERDFKFKNTQNAILYFIAEFKEEKNYGNFINDIKIKIYQNPEEISKSIIEDQYPEYLI